jgi:hypothetical protein
MQFDNLTLIATALVLGAKFSLTEINRMWLAERGISSLSHFLSDSKFCPPEMQDLYALQVLRVYKITGGYFLIDDTMKHHTKFCKWIHGICVLFDHSLNTNHKAICIVFLYYSDGALIKFPLNFKIFYKAENKMPWKRGKQLVHKTKYELAIELIEWALKKGFPRCTVLADSWFGIGPFIKELQRLKLSYIVEIKTSYNVKVACETAKLTPTGRKAKRQCDLVSLPEYFASIPSYQQCGLDADLESGKQAKVLYHVKTVTLCLNSINGKHRIVESVDPIHKTSKYFLTDQLTWEATKILSAYNTRWVIEEFFRNAKQLSDMEGATIRSEQGVTISLCLVSWIDFLLHFENYKQSTAVKLPKESLTIPSIVRQQQYENTVAVIDKVQHDPEFAKKWLELIQKNMIRNRKKRKDLIVIEQPYCRSQENSSIMQGAGTR